MLLVRLPGVFWTCCVEIYCGLCIDRRRHRTWNKLDLFLLVRLGVALFSNVGFCGAECSNPHKSHKRVYQTDALCFVDTALCLFCSSPPCGLGSTSPLFLYPMPAVVPSVRWSCDLASSSSDRALSPPLSIMTSVLKICIVEPQLVSSLCYV